MTNCVDVTVHTYTPRAPVLLGDNRGLVFAPYQTFYPGMLGHLRRVGLLRTESEGASREAAGGTGAIFLEDCWDQVIDLDTNIAADRGVAKSSFKLMDPEDFFPFTIPSPSDAIVGNDVGNTDNLPPPPAKYAEALKKKVGGGEKGLELFWRRLFFPFF